MAVWCVSYSLFSMICNFASAREQASTTVVAQDVVKAGDIISGTVSDSEGPMMMVNVVERDSLDRVVAHSITDLEGRFSFRLVNPDDRIHVAYVGYEVFDTAIDRKNFDVKLKEGNMPDIEVVSERVNQNMLPASKSMIEFDPISMAEFEDLGITTMKRHRVILSFLLLLLTVAVTVSAQNQERQMVTVDGICYELHDNHRAFLDSFATGSDGRTELVIPQYINADGECYRVQGIRHNAFEGNTDIVSVSLPDSIIIMDRAFKNCTNLKLINVPKNGTLINNVFENCTSLEEIEIPYGCNILNGNSFFMGCTSLKRVVIGDGIDYIPHKCFYGCTSLEELVMSSSIGEIGKEAFAGCTNLKRIIINPTDSRNYLYMSVSEGAFPDKGLLESAIAATASTRQLNPDDVIRGVVRDENGYIMMVEVAEVDPCGNKVGQDFTSRGGEFAIQLENPAHSIRFSCRGYETVELPVNSAYYVVRMERCSVPDADVPPRKGKAIRSHKGHEYVDLGLSVKWATCNLGASRPEEQGDVFTLGETAPVPDDMAHLGRGGRWRMPTSAEFYELCINCAWEWTTRDSVQGYKVISKIPGYTDRSIFLPVGDGYSGLLPFYTGPRGEYWSSTVITDNPDYTFILYFDSGNVDVRAYNRKFSRSLRPVTQ